jgi:uncharacterized membrane protein YeaQ/YmgE (transglycosylase-associated protein family)
LVRGFTRVLVIASCSARLATGHNYSARSSLLQKVLAPATAAFSRQAAVLTVAVSSWNALRSVPLIASHVEVDMHILWVIIIGFVAGIIARMLAPGPNNPAGFILTTILGIVGAFVATFIGQAVGWYGPNQGAGLIGAVVGAIVVLFVWHRLVTNRVISDPGSRRWL